MQIAAHIGEVTEAGEGTVLDGVYTLVRRLATGGMASVFEARQRRLGKRVAIKIMARSLASNEEALARFRREAEVTSEIGHPHIVHVFDVGSTRTGEPYLVMELLEGEDLERRLGRVGRLPLATVAAVVQQTASALAAAHARGVVHRDLKPANVFLLELPGEPDFVKVVDFGISKARAAATRITDGSQAMIGTPQYMSPEQAAGRLDEVDHRTDQWALACMAWEMLAGVPPFQGDDVSTLLFQITHGTPRPLAGAVLGVPPEVEEVLRRALAKDPGARYPTVTAFARAFAVAATQAPSPLNVFERRRSGMRARLGIAVAVAVAVFAVGAWLVERDVRRFETNLNAPATTKLTRSKPAPVVQPLPQGESLAPHVVRRLPDSPARLPKARPRPAAPSTLVDPWSPQVKSPSAGDPWADEGP